MSTHEKQSECKNKVFDSYKVHRKFSSGNRNTCYLVECAKWEEKLRLKEVCVSDMSETSLAFLRYAWKRWVGLSGHPHLVHAHYLTSTENHCYLLTEYVHGRNLTDYLHEETRDQKQKGRLALQLIYALIYAHKNNLVHGHITPENILISGDDLLLGDFYGICPGNYSRACFDDDFDGFAKILRYLFCGTPVSAPYDFVLEFSKQDIPDALGKLISDIVVPVPGRKLSEISDRLKEILDDEYCPVMPLHWQMENLHKHSFAWSLEGKEKQAEYLWYFASSQKKPSLHALWNSYLAYLHRGAISFEKFMEIIDSMGGSAQVVCAQAQLALETGAHIQFYLEKVQKFHAAVESTAALLRVEGDLFYRLGKYESAMSRFEKLLKMEERQTDDWYRLAACFRQMEKIDKALTACREGLNVNGCHLSMQLVQISCLYEKDAKEDVGKMFDELVKQQPNFLWGLIHAAEFYAGRGIYRRETSVADKNLAEKYFMRALQLSPNNQRALRGYKACGGNKAPDTPASVTLDGWSQIKCLGKHPNMVTATVISKDENWAISGDCEGNLYLWDVRSENQVGRLLGHRKHITAVAISEDSSCAVSASWDQAVKMWEIPSGKCVWEINDHQDKISCVDLSPDGRFVITGSWDGTAQVWDSESRNRIANMPMGDDWVVDVAISSDGSLAISCDQKRAMYLWKVSDQEIIARMQGSTVALSSDDKLAVSAIEDKIFVWDMKTGKSLKEISARGFEKCLAITDDNLFLLTRNEDEALSIWDLWRGRRLAIPAAEDVVCGDITGNGRYFICGEREEVYLWENIEDRAFPMIVNSGFLLPSLRDSWQIPGLIRTMWAKAESALTRCDYSAAFQGYSAILKIPGYECNAEAMARVALCAEKARGIIKTAVDVHLYMEQLALVDPTAIAICSQGEIGLLASFDDPLQLWNFRSGYRLDSIKEHSRCVSALAVSRDGHLAVSGSWDGTVRLRSLEQPASTELITCNSWVTALAISADGARVVCGARSGELIIHDIASAAEHRFAFPANGSVSHVSISTEGLHALSAFKNGEMCVWNLDKAECVISLRPHGRMATAAAIARDGRACASACRTGEILVWKTATGDIIAKLMAPEVIRGLAIVSETILLSISQSGFLQLWDISGGECVFNQALLEREFLTAWDISADNRFLAIAGDGKKISLWEIVWQWAV